MIMRPEVYQRVLAQRVRLNRAILKNKYHCLPVDDAGHEEWEPVGRGLPSSPSCAVWRGLVACKDVDRAEGSLMHEGLSLNCEDSSGKVVVRHKHWFCHNPRCPVCFIRGFSVRGARNIASRLEEGVRRGLGKIEFVTVSPPPEQRDLPVPVLAKRARKALKDRGCFGGSAIFHGYRIDRERGCLVWSPHWHSLSFIRGGFDRCRNCRHEHGACASCDGFKGRELRGFAQDRYLVKVHDERQTVFGSAFYELNHASTRTSFTAGRFHIVSYYGAVQNRKFKAPMLPSSDVCPVCLSAGRESEMVRCSYVGKKRLVKDTGHVDYKAVFLDSEFEEDGKAKYVELIGGRGDGG
jgi:hypothetical protein